MLISCNSDTTSSVISSNGVTWTLASSPTSGTFVTGDPYVVGAVTVNSVSPAWGDTANTNGSMVNPNPADADQGYDNRSSPAMTFPYNAAKRTTFPVTLNPGDSLVSTVGKTAPTTGGGATHVAKVAVLTCLASAPASAAFRPTPVLATKNVHLVSSVNYGLLPGLAVPSGCTVIDMSGSGNFLNKIWLDHGNIQTSHAQIFPQDHCAVSTGGYPYHRAQQLSQMAVLCLTNNAQATSVANRLIQYGIDLRGCMNANGETWARQAGFGISRKWPLLFAEKMLGGSWSIPFYVTGSSGQLKFQEDAYTYIGAAGVARWGENCAITSGDFSGGNHTCRPTAGDVDQWKMQYQQPPTVPAEGVTAGTYEVGNTPVTFPGLALAARLMAHSWVTDWPAFFAYVERYITTIAVEQRAAGYLSDLTNPYYADIYQYSGNGSLFMKRMWETYR